MNKVAKYNCLDLTPEQLREQIEEKNQTLRKIMAAAEKGEFSIVTRPKFKTTIEHLKSLGYNIDIYEGYMSATWGLK